MAACWAIFGKAAAGYGQCRQNSATPSQKRKAHRRGKNCVIARHRLGEKVAVRGQCRRSFLQRREEPPRGAKGTQAQKKRLGRKLVIMGLKSPRHHIHQELMVKVKDQCKDQLKRRSETMAGVIDIAEAHFVRGGEVSPPAIIRPRRR